MVTCGASMIVYVDPVPSTLSLAMHRVAAALRCYAPLGVTFAQTPQEADLQVFHVIGPGAHISTPGYAVIQYCLYSSEGIPAWYHLWRDAQLVWSYYSMEPLLPRGVPFYHAPLGVDGSVFRPGNGAVRYLGVVSSGYVAGAGAEAIEEIAEAALATGLSVFHLGPANVDRMAPRREASWQAGLGLSDGDLS